MDCRKIQFCDRRTQVDFQQLQALFNLAAFWARDRRPEDLQIAIANSNPVITAWDTNLKAFSHEQRMIGFARATSDGIYRATIWDVVIHPDYQGAGLGRKLVQTVISHPNLSRVERVYLMTTHQQEFYKKIGFESNTSTTMVLHNQPIEDVGLRRETFGECSVESRSTERYHVSENYG